MSYAVSIIDRHPIAQNWVHWFVSNIPPVTREIKEHASGIRDKMPTGRNSATPTELGLAASAAARHGRTPLRNHGALLLESVSLDHTP
jgi:phosphatidylethanolamine-binding protein (PEBP) family uncharacterized protein